MEKANENIVYWTLMQHGDWAIYIAAAKEGLCYVGSQNAPFEELVSWVKKRLPDYNLLEDQFVLKPYIVELIGFLEGRKKGFSSQLDLRGTEFQLAIWKALQDIPYGQTVSYTDIAERIQRPKSVRAVGTAIGANPVLIIIPCHRVIAKSGKLTGYRGGLDMKEELLRLEKCEK